MTKAYQERLALILNELDLELGPDIALLVKPFFGGAAAYVNGRICLSLTKVGFALKLPEVDRQALMKLGGQPLRYFPNAPVKKDYLILSDEVMSVPESLRLWVTKCIGTAAGKTA